MVILKDPMGDVNKARTDKSIMQTSFHSPYISLVKLK